MERVIARIREDSSRHLDELKQILTIPSISSDPTRKPAMEETAQWLLRKMQGMGLKSEVIPTPGHSVVYGETTPKEGAKTVLVYGHYDVQPVDPLELWDSDPFAPELRDGAIYARGASDDKGQLLIHLYAAEAFLAERGSTPVNLKFILEGEEEVGSPNFKPFVEENRDRLACDVVMVSDTSFFARGVPSLVYGLRGLAYLEVIVRGANRDLHSGSFGGAVCNPADALAGMIASLHDARRRVAAPGFYDKVRPLTESERATFAALPFDEEAFAAELGIKNLQGEEGFTTLEQLTARPTLEVNGLVSGFTGEGAKTVLPSEARAKISCRLVPDQDPDEVNACVEDALRDLAPAGVELEFVRHHGGKPFLAEPDNPFVAAGRKALELAFGKEALLTREGGSIPVVETFQSALGVPSVLMGVGLPDDRLHAPNEKLDLDQFHRGIEAAAWFMEEAGA